MVHKTDVEKAKEEQKQTNPFVIASISSEEQARITDAIIEYIIYNDEPISLPEKQSFRALMKKLKPNWKPICKKTV